ncbi:competence protein CoiA [Sporolactobacillus terrae]|uniref:Competence protein n=1 Tax=Sporolactobacillus terrae TaxID=269673 RepID=A0A5K7WUV9_9BACL|nr:competence protein CoiA family protein [Sporolactobacillus terrae]UAK16959.1 competence protein [Sporolactobacillus terrae]BBN98471.1 competence protein [Sporolactobacillus terrae]
MLIASTVDAQRISLAERAGSREELTQLRNQSFRCPICHAPVLLKAGEKRRWHFAHRPHHTCLVENEPETEAHLAGKYDLFHWSRSAGRAPRLEYYLPELHQRPDVYLPGIEPTALEYQCSAIPEKRLAERSIGYLQRHITPIWIIGTHHYSYKRNMIRLSGFVSMAIRRSRAASSQHPFSSPYFIWFYNASTKCFLLASCLTPLSKTYFISQQSYCILSECKPYQLLAPHLDFAPEPFIRLWLTMKKRKRLARPLRMTREEYLLRSQVYQFRQQFAWFPSYVGLPHHSFMYFLNPPLLWQMWLVLLLGRIQPGDWFTPERMLAEASRRGVADLFALRPLPLCPIKTAGQLIAVYLTQLVRLHVAEQSGTSYRMFPYPVQETTFTECLEQDRQTLVQLETALLHDPIKE